MFLVKLSRPSLKHYELEVQVLIRRPSSAPALTLDLVLSMPILYVLFFVEHVVLCSLAVTISQATWKQQSIGGLFFEEEVSWECCIACNCG